MITYFHTKISGYESGHSRLNRCAHWLFPFRSYDALAGLFSPLAGNDLADVPKVCHRPLGLALFGIIVIFHIYSMGTAIGALRLYCRMGFELRQQVSRTRCILRREVL